MKMLLQPVRCVALCVIMLCSGLAQAVVVDDLFVATAAVENRSSEARDAGVALALQDVIVRVSGSEEYLQRPEIQRALKNSNVYLQEYQYVTGENDETLLSARFSQSAIERMFASAVIPVWPENRPRVFVALVSRSFPEGVQLVLNTPSDTDNSVHSLAYSAIIESADNRAIPITTPLLDLEDQLSMDADGLWGLQENAIDAAAARYSPDAILIGKLSQTSSGRWLIGWWFRHNAQFDIFESDSADLNTALDQGLATTAKFLAKTYAITSSSQTSGLNVRLSGIEEFLDYYHAVDYLSQLAVVESAQVTRINGLDIDLTLVLNGELSAFEDTLALDKKMERVQVLGTPGDQFGGSASPLPLRWLGQQP
ncbi:DUF2066 domain-containing protein [Sessilibacter corallicola]